MSKRKRKATFARRTYAIYRHQEIRHKGKLPYTLDDLRTIVREMLEAQECPYCTQPLTIENFSVDHGIPLSRGGASTIDNLIVCCRRCNEAKGNLTGGEYARLRQFTLPWHEQARKDLFRRLRAGGRIRKGNK